MRAQIDRDVEVGTVNTVYRPQTKQQKVEHLPLACAMRMEGQRELG